MKLGKVGFVKREVERDIRGFLDPATTVPKLVCTYYVESEEDVKVFADFMGTSLVEPLIEDAAKYTDCEIDWIISRVESC